MKKFILSIATALVVVFTPSILAADTAIRFMSEKSVSARLLVDIGPNGVHSWIIKGIKDGAFAEQGIDVEFIGKGPGSVKTGIAIAAGKAEIGYQDYSGVVLVNSKTDTPKVRAIFVVDDKAQDGVFSFKEKNITSFNDLEGKTLGGYITGVTNKVLPAITDAKWEMVNMPFSARVPSLVTGKVDAVEGFLTSNVFNFEKVGVTRDKLNIVKTSDKFPMAVSRVITVNADWADENPNAVIALRKVIRELLINYIIDPKTSVTALEGPVVSTSKKRTLEVRRAKYGIKELIWTDFVKVNGISNAKAVGPRLSRYTSLLVDKLELPNRHPDSKYFDLD